MSAGDALGRAMQLDGALVDRLSQIDIFAMDVDGVLTDGQILLGPDGREWKAFNARDGVALKLLHNAGLQSAIITARGSPAVQRRAGELGIRDVFLNARDKGATIQELSTRRRLPLERIAFIGDDLQDLCALTRSGFSFSVADCPDELKQRVDYVTQARGGAGAVREAIEVLLKARGLWDRAVEPFLQ